jgi:hypothetical protein
MGGEFKGDAQFRNEPLIFDTPVWIDFLKNKSNPEADLLTSYIGNDDQVLLTPTIFISKHSKLKTWNSKA